VAKLFHIVEPDVAFFGQKDAAQSAIIRKMVKDLNFPVEIAICPIVREPDGLAMSSRNAYLNAEQRQQGLVLSRALRKMERLFEAGERDVERLGKAGKEIIATEPDAKLDYLLVVDPDTLEPAQQAGGPMLIAVAAWIGSTRLIDNVILRPR
jgi:pantoate--beta-alanine ligase